MSNQYSGAEDSDPDGGCVVIGAALGLGGLGMWTIVWLFFGLTGVLLLALALLIITVIGAFAVGRS